MGVFGSWFLVLGSWFLVSLSPVVPWAFRKAYRKAMEDFIEEVETRCRFCGIDHILLKTDDELGLALSHYLHQRQRTDHSRRGGKMSNFGG